MTKRERQARVQQVKDELLALMRSKFPLIEHISTEMRPAGTVVLTVYAPYEDRFEILEATGSRLPELSVSDDLHFVILPLHNKPEKIASKKRNVAA